MGQGLHLRLPPTQPVKQCVSHQVYSVKNYCSGAIIVQLPVKLKILKPATSYLVDIRRYRDGKNYRSQSDQGFLVSLTALMMFKTEFCSKEISLHILKMAKSRSSIKMGTSMWLHSISIVCNTTDFKWMKIGADLAVQKLGGQLRSPILN